MRYEELQPATLAEAEASLASSDFVALSQQVIAVSLYSAESDAASSHCARVAVVPHAIARGNAILGFGHLARRFRNLNRSVVEPIVRKGLGDPEPYVRSQASDAADDLETFLGWKLSIDA